MALDDLRDFLDVPQLTLPIGGRQYVVLPVTAAVWLRLQSIADDAAAAKDGSAEAKARADRVSDVDIYRMALGPVFDEMLNEVSGPELSQAGMTAWFWQLGQQGLAETYWRSGGKVLTARPATTSTGGRAARSKTASPSSTKRRPRSSGA